MKTLKIIIPYLVIITFGILMISPIFQEGFLTSIDNPIHVIESYTLIENIKEHRWINGWVMDAFLGYPLQQFPRYQIGIWLVAILNMLLSIPLEVAYKIILTLSYIFPAAALFFAAKKIFKNNITALIPAILFLVIRRDVIVTALTGQWNSLLALGFLIIFIYQTHKFFQEPDMRNSVKLSILFTLTVLSHLFTGIGAGLFFGIYFIVHWTKRKFPTKGFAYGILTFLIGILLCAFYLYPALDTYTWLAKNTGWPPAYGLKILPYKVLAPFIFAVPKDVTTQMLFEAFQNNTTLFFKLSWTYFIASIPQLLIFILGIIGIIQFSERWKKNDHNTILLMTILAFMIISLVIGSGFWFSVESLKGLPFLNTLVSYRFLTFTNIGLLIFGGYALLNMNKESYPRKLYFMWAIFDKRKIIGVVTLLFFIANINAYTPSQTDTMTIKQSSVDNDFYMLTGWIKENVDKENTRIVYEDFYGNFKDPKVASSHLNSMMFYYTGVYSVGGWYPSSSYPTDQLSFTSSGNAFGKRIEETDDRFIAEKMKLVNAKYIVTLEDKLDSKISKSKLFKKEYNTTNYNLYSLKEYKPEWFSYNGTFEYNITKFKNQEFAFDYKTDADKEVMLKISYHPYWHAYLDGKEVKINRSKEDLMIFDLEKGEHEIILTYKPVKISYIILSLATLGFCIYILAFRRTLR